MFEEIGGFPEASSTHTRRQTSPGVPSMPGIAAVRRGRADVSPGAAPTRHATFFRLNARNRVFLARRNLPFAVGVIYVLDWMLLMVVRTRSVRSLAAWFVGLWRGLVEPCGERRPIRWRTVWRMTRLGRPPVL